MRGMFRSLFAAMLVFVASVASAQNVATPAKALAWDQGSATAAEAQAMTYKIYADGATVGTVLANVTCSSATAPVVCSAPFVAFTPGQHTITLTATNAAGESAKSAPFTFTFVVLPAVPANVRAQ